MKNSKKSIQLFDNPILESLTHTNSAVVISVLTLISFGVFAYGMVYFELETVTMVLLLILGFVFFTLAEYLIHRFIFHSGEYTNTAKWQFKMHGIHHATPTDEQRLAMPLPLSLLLASIFFLAFWLVMRNYAFFFFPGFLLGYSFYLLVHYLIHLRRPPKNIFRILWKHHQVHHYKDDHAAFGVTTPLWDIVFGTMPTSKKD